MVKLAALTILAAFFLGGPARGDDEAWRLWIERLTDADWQVREEATRRLLESGEPVRAALEELVETDDPELEHRVRFLLAHLGNRLAGPGIRLAASGSATIVAGDIRRIVLTTGPGQAGSVFDEVDRGTDSFASVFRFSMGSPSGSWDGDGVQGADGMAYVLAADPRALGETGGGPGRDPRRRPPQRRRRMVGLDRLRRRDPSPRGPARANRRAPGGRARLGRGRSRGGLRGGPRPPRLHRGDGSRGHLEGRRRSRPASRRRSCASPPRRPGPPVGRGAASAIPLPLEEDEEVSSPK